MRDPEDALEREPTLDDVLSDPSVRALMTSDHVEAEHLRGMLQRLRTQQTRRPPGEAKAAAAHDWMTSLHERGRALGLRYSARTVVVSG
jgi:hypothetical protein